MKILSALLPAAASQDLVSLGDALEAAFRRPAPYDVLFTVQPNPASFDAEALREAMFGDFPEGLVLGAAALDATDRYLAKSLTAIPDDAMAAAWASDEDDLDDRDAVRPAFVGLTVLFREHNRRFNGLTTTPAIITRVYADMRVNLMILPDGGEPYARLDIPFEPVLDPDALGRAWTHIHF
jgi:hypothetical protein